MAIDVASIRQIGRYPVEHFVAEGGMAWVFRVVDPELFNAPRALKLLKPAAAQGDDYQRFIAEAQILATIQHPNLIHVFDFGTDDATGCHFYTMDFIEGQTLDDIPPDWFEEEEEFEEEDDADATPEDAAADPDATAYIHVSSTPDDVRYTVRDVCEYFSGVLAALSRLHRENVIHRDIKPENIFLTHDGIAVLGDLGIAKARHSSVISEAGRVPGTPLYMAPEHARGEPTNARSDIFSLGLSLFAVLSGETVYEQAEEVDASDSQSVLRHLLTLNKEGEEFEFVFHDSIPDSICDIIEKACAIKPRDRYANADEMNEALRDALNESREIVRGGARTWVAASLALIFLGLAGYFALQPPPDPAVDLETQQALEEARQRAKLLEEERKAEEERIAKEREEARKSAVAAEERLARIQAELQAAEDARAAEEARLQRERDEAAQKDVEARNRLARLEEQLEEAKNRPDPVAPAEKDAELRQVMRDYETAYESRSINDLNRVWSMSRFERANVERLFDDCDLVRVQIDILDSTMSQNTGRVDYEETINYRECDEQRPGSRYSVLSASFARRGDGWQIKAIRQQD